MKVVVTGADGFLGWHICVYLRAHTPYNVVRINRENWNQLPIAVDDADGVIHVAGVNRGPDSHVAAGNLTLAQDVAKALRSATTAPTLVYANSTHSAGQSIYGQAKGAAAELLSQAAAEVGGHFIDVLLPNLFGEHGRPNYNSFVATFADMVVAEREPVVDDRTVELLYAQEAARTLVEALAQGSSRVRPRGMEVRVSEVLRSLLEYFDIYRHGEIPVLNTRLDLHLFNTLRSSMFPASYPMHLNSHIDARGGLVEVVRAHGSEGQTFISTTKPGFVRGQHYHLRKIERFVVVEGMARITLRRLLTNETVSFEVSGEKPAIIDMPTFWAHNLENIGHTNVTTVFWTNELFDPADTDTFAEEV